jgi:hypothetical protein
MKMESSPNEYDEQSLLQRAYRMKTKRETHCKYELKLRRGAESIANSSSNED